MTKRRGDTPERDAYLEMLEASAREGTFPNVSPCPVGCRFCYERHLRHFYPTLEVQRIRPPTAEELDHFERQLRRHGRPACPSAPISHEGGVVRYRSASDIFAQGLSLDQLERLVAQNQRVGHAPYMNATGKGLELEAVRRLSERYPDTFRLRLSVLTFNDEIKRQLIPRWPGSGDLKRAIGLLREARIYLIHLGVDQTLEDLDTIDASARRGDGPNVVIAPLHHTSRHPEVVATLARRGLADYEELIARLDVERGRWPRIGDIFFHHPPQAYAWRFRNTLRALLAPLRLGRGDVVLCSTGASDVLRDHVVRRPARVLAVADGLGGSTTFAMTITTGDVARVLDGAGGAGEIRRAVVPSTVWWVNDGERCLGGGTTDDLGRRFPGIEVVRVEVPGEIVDARLTLDECLDYYRTDLERTARLRDERGALGAHARPPETVTQRGYIRRLALDDGAFPLDPAALDQVGERKLSVSYDEVLVRRGGGVGRETVFRARLGPRSLARFRSLFIDGGVDRDSALFRHFADYELPA
jgi:hypothetical protein